MGLVIRLKHALGEQWFDLPSRPAETPVVIGRAADADISVPAVDISPRHTAMFMHEDRWVVQDLGNPPGTFLNGQPLDTPTFVQPGDVITLGNSATSPRVEIDPQSAKWAKEGRVVARPPTPVPPASPEPMPAEPWPLPAEQPGAIYVRRKTPPTPAAVVIVTLLGAAVLGSGAYLIYQRLREPGGSRVVIAPPALPVVTPPPEHRAAASTQPHIQNNIFQFGGLEPATRPSNSATGAASPPATAATAPAVVKAATRPIDPADWEKVKTAFENEDPSAAIVRFHQFARDYPGQNETELSTYTADMLDRIWWDRIDQLLDQKKAARKAFDGVKEELGEPTLRDTRKEVLKSQQQKYTKELEAIASELDGMNYISEQPPPLYDEQEMIRLRDARRDDYFGKWKERVLQSIDRNGGKLPWPPRQPA